MSHKKEKESASVNIIVNGKERKLNTKRRGRVSLDELVESFETKKKNHAKIKHETVRVKTLTIKGDFEM